MKTSLLSAVALLCALAICTMTPAFAADAVLTAPATAVQIPYGDWVIAFGQLTTLILLPFLVGVVTWAVHTYVPIVGAFVSQALVQRVVQNAVDYATNAIDGAVKGQQLTVPIGSAVITKATQRVIDVAPAWILKTAGGPEGVAEKVFRILHLEPGATAANTLVPGMQAVPVK